MESGFQEGKITVEIEAYLYDADGSDREIDLTENILESLNDKQLLWINVLQREEDTLKRVASILNLKDIPFKTILNISERPKLDKFEQFYRFFIVSVEFDDKDNLSLLPIDFIVGKNFVITVHKGLVKYFREFIECENGETHIGELDAESFIASLLDLHIVSYFRALEKIERRIDKLDEKILKKDLETQAFLTEIVKLRSDVSRLRRWLMPHRDVFYALSRPDFKVIADSDSFETFQHLSEHFENCVNAIEISRDTVLSLFDLYATKNAHNMNNLMKRLTFVTLIVGGLGAIAGVWGMNFEVHYFKFAETGFWMTMLGMGVFVVVSVILGKILRWF